MLMKSISEADLTGKRVLIRVDFNVPLDEDRNITDDNRIRAALPTILEVLDRGGSAVLMSHLGRPKGKRDPNLSMNHLIPHLSNLLDRKVLFASSCVGESVLALSQAIVPGEVILLENLRFHPEEKKGDVEFAKQLARLGQVYVNDAFGTAHRAHASTSVVAQFFEEKYAGYLMQEEVNNARQVMNNAEKPFTAIMGGAKVSDKINIIQNLLPKIDYLLIGGGMAYTFLKAKGYEIGNSLLEQEKIALAAAIMKKARALNVTLLTPVDSVVADAFSEDAKTAIVKSDNFPADMMGLDIGPQTFKEYYEVIMKSKTILWNGPMGVFEMEPFAQGTIATAAAVAEATKAGAFSLIGGGDSAAAIRQTGREADVSYVSTGGGALLEFFEGEELPGVAALG